MAKRDLNLQERKEIDETVTQETEINETVTEAAEPAEEIKVVGVVANCHKLNVRKKPNANDEVVTVIDKGTEVEIDEEKSTKGFYKISTKDGVKGFCMKQFITVKQ